MFLDIPVIVTAEQKNRNGTAGKIIYYLDYVTIKIKEEEREMPGSFYFSNEIKKYYQSNMYSQNGKEILEKRTKHYCQDEDGNIFSIVPNLSKYMNFNFNNPQEKIELFFKKFLKKNLFQTSFLEELYGPLIISKKKFETNIKSDSIFSNNKQFLQNKIQDFFDENYFVDTNNSLYTNNEQFQYYFYIPMEQEISRRKKRHITVNSKNNLFNSDLSTFENKNDIYLGTLKIPMSLPVTAKRLSDLYGINGFAFDFFSEKKIPNFQFVANHRTPASERDVADSILNCFLNIYKPIDIRELGIESLELYLNVSKSLENLKNEKQFENIDILLLQFSRFCESIENADIKKKVTENYEIINNFYHYAMEERENCNNIEWTENSWNPNLLITPENFHHYI